MKHLFSVKVTKMHKITISEKLLFYKNKHYTNRKVTVGDHNFNTIMRMKFHVFVGLGACQLKAICT
jgi:hypothetical protein